MFFLRKITESSKDLDESLKSRIESPGGGEGIAREPGGKPGASGVKKALSKIHPPRGLGGRTESPSTSGQSHWKENEKGKECRGRDSCGL